MLHVMLHTLAKAGANLILHDANPTQAPIFALKTAPLPLSASGLLVTLGARSPDVTPSVRATGSIKSTPTRQTPMKN